MFIFDFLFLNIVFYPQIGLFPMILRFAEWLSMYGIAIRILDKSASDELCICSWCFEITPANPHNQTLMVNILVILKKIKVFVLNQLGILPSSHHKY